VGSSSSISSAVSGSGLLLGGEGGGGGGGRTLFSSSKEGEKVGKEVTGELKHILERGPKAAILEALRALVVAIPSAPPQLRDDFILVCLLNLSAKVTCAAAAGHEAAQELAASLSLGSDAGVREAAKGALMTSRAAAIQGNPPWPKAKSDELNDVALSLEVCFCAFRGVLWTAGGEVAGGVQSATAGLVKDAWKALLDPTLLLFPEDLLRMKREMYHTTFPPPHTQQHNFTFASPQQHQHHQGGQWEEGHDHQHSSSSSNTAAAADNFTGVDDSLAAEFASAGISPETLLHSPLGGEGGGGGGGGGGGAAPTRMPPRGQGGKALKSGGGARLMGGADHGLGSGSTITSTQQHPAARSTPERAAAERRGSWNLYTGGLGGGGGGGGGVGAPTSSSSSANGAAVPSLSMSAFTSGVDGGGGGGARRSSLTTSSSGNNNHQEPPISNMNSFLGGGGGAAQTLKQGGGGGGGGGAAAAPPPLHPPHPTSSTSTSATAGIGGTPGKAMAGFGLKGMMSGFGLGGQSKTQQQ